MAITSKGGVLIIAHAFPPENLVGALRPYRFFKYLPKFGYTTHVVTASDQDPGNTPDRVHHSIDPLRQGSGLARVGRACMEYLYPGTGPVLGWVPRAYATASRVLRTAPISVILSSSPPSSVHLTAFWLKQRNPGLKWVADFRDPMKGNPVGPTGISSTLLRIGDSWVEPLIFRHADLLIANTDTTAKMWQGSYPEGRHKITYIWNGFDPDETIGPAALQERDYRVLAHVGEIYGGRHPGILLASLLRLIEGGRLDPNRLRVRLIGPLDRDTIPREDILDELIARGCVAVEVGTPSPQEAAQSMMEAHLLLLIDWVGKSSGLQVPSKLYPYLRIGRPILAITRKDSPVARILASSGVPFVALYPDDSYDAVDEKVLAFVKLSSEPTTASEWFWQTFDVERQAQQLAQLLDRL